MGLGIRHPPARAREKLWSVVVHAEKPTRVSTSGAGRRASKYVRSAFEDYVHGALEDQVRDVLDEGGGVCVVRWA